ncbi:uncharacterized protein LOC132275863 [Cornus florida]|uniref:uncharacterized protein LOC132275863 n=1 Tax=Cornus florida TaxID=4283 RepID=UPI00289F10E2|nr:uncharacterized protein LOC132275863 [Cornus florida]
MPPRRKDKAPRSQEIRPAVGLSGESSASHPVGQGGLPQPVMPVGEDETKRRLKLISTFVKLMPTLFKGGTDPLLVDDWFDQVEKHIDALAVENDSVKILLATYNFTRDAKLWWKSVSNGMEVKTLSWDAYKELFYNKFFRATKRWELHKEFISLFQNNSMTVTDYKNKFTSLSRFAPEIVSKESDKVHKLGISGSKDEPVVQGLRVSLARGIKGVHLSLEDSSQADLFLRLLYHQEQSFSTRACFGYGQLGHRVRDCPRKTGGSGRGSSSGRVSGSLVVSRVVQDCAIVIAGWTQVFYLILLKMTGFDVILSMDWLSSFHATIDCFNGRVSVCMPEGDCFVFVGDRGDSLVSACYGVHGWDRCDFFLASILAEEDGDVETVYPSVVCEFLDVILDDLPDLPPRRKVEFVIDLMPGTAPISLAPYRMAPAELEEL